MPQIRFRLLERRDREGSRHLALSQASDLRKHEPHPVTRLLTTAQLANRSRIRAAGVLGCNETLEVVRIIRHGYTMIPPRSACGRSREAPVLHVPDVGRPWSWFVAAQAVAGRGNVVSGDQADVGSSG